MKRQRSVRFVRAGAKTTALVALLLLGAYVMALADGASASAWLGWLSLIPLFLVIRLWRPAAAMLAGALWGACLFGFSLARPEAAVAGTIRSLLLLPAVPAVYAYLAARLTRRIGFNPFVLGVGWMGVELALAPAGLGTGLLASTRSDGTFLHWVSQALGYVLVAFVVALVNASLVSLLSGARLSLPQVSYRIPSRDCGASLSPQTFSHVPLFAIRPSRPRAPPPATGLLARMSITMAG